MAREPDVGTGIEAADAAFEREIRTWTDHYFLKTRRCAEAFGKRDG
jgi:hypothetical protein